MGCKDGLISKITDFGIYADESDAEHFGSCSNTSDFKTSVSSQCDYLYTKTSDLYVKKLGACLG